jgi:ASPM-SPD-2-Hydin domain-containing protein
MGLPQPKFRRVSAPVLPVVTLMILVTILPAPVFATATQLSCLPTTLGYGSVAVGASQTLLAAVTNNGPRSVTISSVTANSSEFKVSKLKLPQVLAVGATLEVGVIFAPSVAGWRNGQLTLLSDASNRTLNLGVWGTGVQIETLTAHPPNLSFGDVKVGESSTLPVVVTNTRNWNVTLTRLQTTGNAFSVTGPKFPITLGQGKSVTLKATFKPNAVGPTGGSSFVPGPSLTIPLSGTGTGTSAGKPELTISPATLDFGNVAVGDEATRTVALRASGGTVDVSSISSNSSQFAAPKLKFPLAVADGKEVTVDVTFSPNKDGNASGALSFASNAERSSMSEPLAGTGAAAGKRELTITPSTINFGKVAVGGTATLTLGLHASGGNVDVSSISSNSSQFSVQKIELPLTVPAGKEVSVNVTFTPKNDGNSSGALSFASNAVDARVSEPTAGTGTAPYVSLSWVPSTSEHITGYNVYRSTSSGATPSKINSKLDPETTYTDPTVAPGHTYYYSTTAVNSSGKESAHSDRVEVAVP